MKNKTKLWLGIDTSNYTTSVAVYDSESGRVLQRKKLLPVKHGERGIRQSDAVFHHTQQIREVMELITEDLSEFGVSDLRGISAVAVSIKPCYTEASYMPCFTVGHTVARTLSTALSVPLYEFSHQEGHISAAVFSAGREDLFGKDFLAFHVSGGTTEMLRVSPEDRCPVSASVIGESRDLKAGQAVDRIGVLLGLDFPCGPALEELALKSKREFDIRIPKLDSAFDCSLSGVENKCKKMIEDDELPCDTALFCIKYIEKAILTMAKTGMESYPELPIVFSGGVMSNSIIRSNIEAQNPNCFFATPGFSSDNAAGLAVLASLMH